MKREKISSLMLIALFSAIISISAFISIPFISLPITMQSLSVALALLMLGGKRGFLSILIYIFIGLVGIPVFSGFSSGLGALFSVNGGFIIGFLIEALVYMIFEQIFGKGDAIRIISYTLGHILLYLCGAVWYFVGFTSGEGFFSVLLLVVLPYILPDIVKFFVAFLIFKRLDGKIKI